MNIQERIDVIQGDITKVQADAIVNAANSSLLGGGGVDGAIHRAGGPEILEACRAIVARQGGCKTGEAVITVAGGLPAQFVIHTVGPVWRGGDHGEAGLLANCYNNALQLAIAHACNSIAFPNISTCVYHFPKSDAARIAITTIAAVLKLNARPAKVLLVCFDEENYRLCQQQLNSFTG